jgi:predicted nucleic acid-binding protein
LIHLLDSDVIIEILLNRDWAVAFHDQLDRDVTAISAMTYGEVWEGILASRNRPVAEAAFEKLIAPFEVIPLDKMTMHVYGEIRVDLRRRGLQIGAPDVLIASTAIQHGLILATRNARHFSRIPALSMVNPSKP